jgi:hypothetical protein
VVVLVGLGAILYVLSSTVGRHYYHITYGMCLNNGLFFGAYCKTWTLQAVFEILAIGAIGISAWVYNERRSI